MPRTLTLADWAEDSARRQRLAALLEEPVMQDAINTLSSSFAEAVPDVISAGTREAAPPATDIVTLLALRHTHRAGFNGFLNALRNLAKERPIRPTRTPRPAMVPEDRPLKSSKS
jgi:hypothetical protein